MAFETQVDSGSARTADEKLTAPASQTDGLLALVLLAGAALAFQLFLGLNADSSWLLTVGEYWLNGARAYVDFVELNPPGSFLSLMPALILARLTGLPPEPIVIIMVAFAALAIAEATTRMSMAAGTVEQPARMRLTLGFMLLVLPMSVFAEREHMATIALVPIWAVMIVRAQCRPASAVFVCLAGIAAGLAMCIKPQFAAAILLPALAMARARRSFTLLFAPEFLIAGGIAGIFGILVLAAFPAFIYQVVPVVIDLYRPVREPVLILLKNEAVIWSLVAIIGLALVARRELLHPRVTIPLLAGLGFGAAMLEQGKGFGYHYYPVVAALVPALIDRGIAFANLHFLPGTKMPERMIGVAGFLLMAIGLGYATMFFFGISKPLAALVGPIEKFAPHPKMVAISPHVWVGHPLTRDVGGTWIGSVPSQWMTLGALYRLGVTIQPDVERKRLEGVIETDRARLAADIARAQADVVIVEHDDVIFPAWFSSDAELAHFLNGYTRKTTVYGVIDLWVRDR